MEFRLRSDPRGLRDQLSGAARGEATPQSYWSRSTMVPKSLLRAALFRRKRDGVSQGLCFHPGVAAPLDLEHSVPALVSPCIGWEGNGMQSAGLERWVRAD
jgi:hypothetical protein